MREIDDYTDTRAGEEVSQHQGNQESQGEEEDDNGGYPSSDEEVDEEKKKVVKRPCIKQMYIMSQTLDLDTPISTSIP